MRESEVDAEVNITAGAAADSKDDSWYLVNGGYASSVLRGSLSR